MKSRNFNGSFTIMSLVVVWISAVFILPVQAASAQQPSDAWKASAEQLLKDFWLIEGDNRRMAESVWAQAEASGLAGISELKLAYIYNRMNHARTKDALKTATELNESAPENIDGRLVRIWLETLRGNLDISLLQIRELNRLISTPDFDPGQRASITKKLGRLIGYIEGPTDRNVNADTLDHVKAEVLANLTPAELKVFRAQKSKLLDEYKTLQASHSQTIGQEEEKLQKQMDAEVKSINQSMVDLTDRISQLQPQISLLRANASAQVSAASAQLSPLQSQLAGLNSAIANVQNEVGFLSLDLIQFRNFAPNHPNIPFLWNAIQNRQFELSSLYGQARSLDNQIIAAQNQVQQIRNDFDRRIQNVNNEIRSAERQKKRGQKRLEKLAKGPVVARGKVQSMNVRTASLITYDSFPLELARQKLLDLVN